MDAIAHAATRRLESSLHAVEVPKAVEGTRTLSVTADYRLSEAGRKASLLSGGNGHAEQRVKIAVPLTRLHLVHVDNNGVARLKLRPQFKLNTDQRIVKIKFAPVYDHPPTLDELFQTPHAIMNSSARITRSERQRRPPGGKRSMNGGIRWRWNSSAIRIGAPWSIRLRRSVAARS